ncbi:MAG: protein NosL [Gammaproteobacteria bacterium]|nr:MAG: protein NosL [Gammaproteobacteria bacterium]
MRRSSWLLPWLLLVVLAACSRAPQTGPVPIRWDREVCTRCRMAISRPQFAAEVRGPARRGGTRVWKFDDIGCAVLWLEQQPWKDDPRVEIWVADRHDGHWIDARKAWYVPVTHSPMGYDLGAQERPAPGALDFQAAVRRIHRVEAGVHRHRGRPPGTAAHAGGEGH